ncbi:hypothetical protein CRM90_29670, partial [Mycobacterium sp. ENV421]
HDEAANRPVLFTPTFGRDPALKREVLQDNSCWPDAATCRREVFRWLARYNIKRRHSYCRHSSPAAYERIHTPATLPKAA